jgi:hypothetical protein
MSRYTQLQFEWDPRSKTDLAHWRQLALTAVQKHLDNGGTLPPHLTLDQILDLEVHGHYVDLETGEVLMDHVDDNLTIDYMAGFLEEDEDRAQWRADRYSCA